MDHVPVSRSFLPIFRRRPQPAPCGTNDDSCLRHSFNLYPKEVKYPKPEPMTLISANEKRILTFDCKACEMHVAGKMKKGVKLNLGAIRAVQRPAVPAPGRMPAV